MAQTFRDTPLQNPPPLSGTATGVAYRPRRSANCDPPQPRPRTPYASIQCGCAVAGKGYAMRWWSWLLVALLIGALWLTIGLVIRPLVVEPPPPSPREVTPPTRQATALVLAIR